MIHVLDQKELRTLLCGRQRFRIVNGNLQIGGPLHNEHRDGEFGDFHGGVILEPGDQVRLQARAIERRKLIRYVRYGSTRGEFVQNPVALCLKAPREFAAELIADQRVSDSAAAGDGDERIDRSEEHTSELQSLTNLVCRLLLEKKKKEQRHSFR